MELSDKTADGAAVAGIPRDLAAAEAMVDRLSRPGADTLSAIVVAYKTPGELAAAVASLQAGSITPEEIIVVDNGAPDGEPLRGRSEWRGVRVELAPANVGYGAGCNIGARSATGNELLVLNADVVLSAGAVAAMRARLASDPRIGVVGPRILSGGEIQLSARAFPSFRTGLLGRRSRLTRLLIRVRRLPAEFRHTYGSGGAVDWVSGACMLVRREAFESVGGFDDRYWMYWEDADLCRRLVDLGWRIFYEPSAVVHHATGASGTNERTIRAFHESAARFARQHIVRSRAGHRAIELVLDWRCRLALRLYSRAGHDR